MPHIEKVNDKKKGENKKNQTKVANQDMFEYLYQKCDACLSTVSVSIQINNLWSVTPFSSVSDSLQRAKGRNKHMSSGG